jgi:photosystem II stability/assembly factor-like uncharacterized protein
MAEGNVYRSEDEGKSWKRVNDVKDGAAAMLIQHPFDNNMVRHLLSMVFSVLKL